MFQINSHKRFPCCISLGSFLITNSMLLMFLMHGRSDITKRCITLLLNTVQGIFMAPFLHVEPPHNSSCPHKGRQWPFRRSVRLTSLHINLVFFFLNGYISAVTQVHNSRQLSVKQVKGHLEWKQIMMTSLTVDASVPLNISYIKIRSRYSSAFMKRKLGWVGDGSSLSWQRAPDHEQGNAQ